MKTQCPISNISYHSKDFLQEKLDHYVDIGLIDFYCFIHHLPEEFEGHEHKHLHIIPNGRIDTKIFNKECIEFFPNEELPRLFMPHWDNSKTLDFILYNLHDNNYCRLKGYDERKYTYTIDEFVTNSKDQLLEYYNQAYHCNEFWRDNRLLNLLKNSKSTTETCKDLVMNGYVPLKNMCGFHHLSQMISGENAYEKYMNSKLYKGDFE